MEWLTRQHILVDAGLDLLEINELHLTAAVNRHARFTFSGRLSREQAKRASRESQSDKLIHLVLDGQTVFCGLPQRIEVREINGAFTINVIALSCTWRLQWTPQSYFYQYTRQRFRDMLEKAVKTAKGGMIATKGGEKIRKPVLQYEQDAWDFALRTASMIQTVITPDISADHPQICLGLPQGKCYTADKAQFQNRLRFQRFRKDNQTRQRDVDAGDYRSFSLKDKRIFRLGDRISSQDVDMPVMELNIWYNGDIVINNYTLGNEADFTPPKWENPYQGGLMLEGKVNAVSGDMVQVCLNIPDDAEEHGATWFDYAPLSNNGMYAMPPVETPLALQWMSGLDGDCKAVRTVRDGAKLDHYLERSVQTEYGKRMYMTPTHVSFFSDSNSICLRNGIQIRTGRKLKLRADKGITLHSSKRLRMRTPEEVFITKPGVTSGILMAGRRIHIKSKQTKYLSNGNGKLLSLPWREPIKQATLKAETVTALSGMIPKMASMKEGLDCL